MTANYDTFDDEDGDHRTFNCKFCVNQFCQCLQDIHKDCGNQCHECCDQCKYCEECKGCCHGICSYGCDCILIILQYGSYIIMEIIMIILGVSVSKHLHSTITGFILVILLASSVILLGRMTRYGREPTAFAPTFRYMIIHITIFIFCLIAYRIHIHWLADDPLFAWNRFLAGDFTPNDDTILMTSIVLFGTELIVIFILIGCFYFIFDCIHARWVSAGCTLHRKTLVLERPYHLTTLIINTEEYLT